MVTGLTGTTYEERCVELGLETLKDRRDQQDLMLALAHKFVGGIIPGGERIFTRTDDPARVRTRQAADPTSLVAQCARTDIRKFSFGVRVIEPWNRLLQDARNCVEKGKFKNMIKTRQRAN
jgi:hypothetical protein